MTGRTHVEESQNVKFEHQRHELSQSINLAAFARRVNSCGQRLDWHLFSCIVLLGEKWHNI